MLLDRFHRRGEPENVRDEGAVEHVIGRHRRNTIADGRGFPRRHIASVVAYEHEVVLLDPGSELLGLHADQAPVGAELHDVASDLAGDPTHHLER